MARLKGVKAEDAKKLWRHAEDGLNVWNNFGKTSMIWMRLYFFFDLNIRKTKEFMEFMQSACKQPTS